MTQRMWGVVGVFAVLAVTWFHDDYLLTKQQEEFSLFHQLQVYLQSLDQSMNNLDRQFAVITQQEKRLDIQLTALGDYVESVSPEVSARVSVLKRLRQLEEK